MKLKKIWQLSEWLKCNQNTRWKKKIRLFFPFCHILEWSIIDDLTGSEWDDSFTTVFSCSVSLMGSTLWVDPWTPPFECGTWSLGTVYTRWLVTSHWPVDSSWRTTYWSQETLTQLSKCGTSQRASAYKLYKVTLKTNGTLYYETCKSYCVHLRNKQQYMY